MTTDPLWLAEARRHIGVREIKGARHNTTISGWLQRLRAWWTDDETPWCGVFVAHCMERAGQPIPRHWYRAKAWLEWGVPVLSPVVGAVAVFGRDGGGHVAFVVGRDAAGNILCLGGNQSDMVRVSAFSPVRVLGYRVPASVTLSPDLPLLAGAGSLSANEA